MLGLNQLSLTGVRGGGTPAVVATNLFRYSEEFDNAYWLINSASVSANTATAPDGSTTADSLIATAVDVSYLYPGSRTWLAAPYTLSCYMKQGTNRYGWLGAYDLTTNFGGVFDLQSGVYVGNRSGGGETTASIVSVGDGWYRCVITFTPVAATANYSTQIGTNNNGSLSLSGSSTGLIYVWGAQLEIGTVANGYVKTT